MCSQERGLENGKRCTCSDHTVSSVRENSKIAKGSAHQHKKDGFVCGRKKTRGERMEKEARGHPGYCSRKESEGQRLPCSAPGWQRLAREYSACQSSLCQRQRRREMQQPCWTCGGKGANERGSSLWSEGVKQKRPLA